MITVLTISDTAYRVIVEQGDEKATFAVTLKPEYHQKLTEGYVSPQELLEKAFQFLLEREAICHIRNSFNLRETGKIYPEFEQVMRSCIVEAHE